MWKVTETEKFIYKRELQRPEREKGNDDCLIREYDKNK